MKKYKVIAVIACMSSVMLHLVKAAEMEVTEINRELRYLEQGIKLADKKYPMTVGDKRFESIEYSHDEKIITNNVTYLEYTAAQLAVGLSDRQTIQAHEQEYIASVCALSQKTLRLGVSTRFRHYGKYGKYSYDVLVKPSDCQK